MAGWIHDKANTIKYKPLSQVVSIWMFALPFLPYSLKVIHFHNKMLGNKQQ